MTTKADWEFRAKFLRQQAEYLDKKAGELQDEARRYRGLAEQADYLARQDVQEAMALANLNNR